MDPFFPKTRVFQETDVSPVEADQQKWDELLNRLRSQPYPTANAGHINTELSS